MGASVLAAVLALALTGCHAGSNKAGGEAAGPTRTLVFVDGFTGTPTQATAFANEVARVSGGSLRIAFKDGWRSGQARSERGIIDDVRGGKVTGALVGARIFDTFGIPDCDVLLAPLVVDTYTVEGAVFAAGIPQQMLPSLSRLGLVGVAVLPGPLRRMFGTSHPFSIRPTSPARRSGSRTPRSRARRSRPSAQWRETCLRAPRSSASTATNSNWAPSSATATRSAGPT